MKTLLTAMFSLLATMDPFITTLIVFATSAASIFTWVNNQVTALMSSVDAMAASSFAGTLNIAPLGLLDTFVPLHEAISYFSAWLVVLSAATVIRMVKSFVPAIAT